MKQESKQGWVAIIRNNRWQMVGVALYIVMAVALSTVVYPQSHTQQYNDGVVMGEVGSNIAMYQHAVEMSATDDYYRGYVYGWDMRHTP